MTDATDALKIEPQPTPKPIYISAPFAINPVTANKFILQTIDIINTQKPTELYYMFSSHGGDVDSGFLLYNFLVAMQQQVEVVMHNVGTIDSIANVVFMGGKRRYANPNASFLFHGVAMNMNGSFMVTALRETLSRLEGMQTRIATTISSNSNLTESELNALFQQGEGKDVHFAATKEIIHEIKPAIVPMGAIHLMMNLE